MFTTVMSPRKNYVILHIEEWKRLKNQASTQTNHVPAENEYIKSLIEKSQKWIKEWPDTVQGHVCQVEKQKKKQHLKDIAMIRQFKMKHKTDTTSEAIEKAKKMIFDESCYGRRLLSALIESKTLEERDVQIRFEKELAQNAKAREREKDNVLGCSLQNATDMEKHEKDLAIRKREINKEVALCNKSIFLAQKEIKADIEEKRKHMELEDLCLIKELIKKETLKESEKQILFKKDLEQITAARKEIEQRKVQREYEDERKAEIWRNYVDRKNYKMEMIHKKRFDAPQFTKHYELLKKLEEEKKSRYDKFINSGITTFTNRQLKQEDDDRNKDNERKANYLLMQSNKKIAETKRISECIQNKCACDRQNIIKTSKSSRKTKNTLNQNIPTFTPTTACVEKFRVKEKEPSPWNGLSATHAQFAQQANETLQQCQYKNMARKVVDDYRRLNCLNNETLPIPDYF